MWGKWSNSLYKSKRECERFEEGAVAVVEATALAEPALPTASPAHAPKLDAEELEEYAALSAAVGVDCCTDLTRERLLKCFRGEGIETYNLSAVCAYLDVKLGNDWEWRGLRTVDAAHLGGWNMPKHDDRRRINFSKEPYRGAVPLPVLLTVQKIQKVMGDAVFFYVSAPANNDGDPFLCVTSRWLSVYVIERWDEPNFRDRTMQKDK